MDSALGCAGFAGAGADGWCAVELNAVLTALGGSDTPALVLLAVVVLWDLREQRAMLRELGHLGSLTHQRLVALETAIGIAPPAVSADGKTLK